MSDASKAKAECFLREETAFRLGALLTEAPHPRTMTLGETLRDDLAAGLRQLLSVDEEIAPVARRVIGNDPGFRRLCEEMKATLLRGGRIFFTGCGATGRLSILLEAMWRGFWREHAQRHPTCAAKAARMEDLVRSVMAGGDFALIRSVEGFEDFTAFGQRQLRDSGVAAGDLVVAVTEGGETSFVIGTAWEGLATGATVFFVFNNPAHLLRQHVQRSREVIDEPRIVKLDLTTGPMAVTGSTRMQATTIELLVLGAAMELALVDILAVMGDEAFRLSCSRPVVADYAVGLEGLVAALAKPASVEVLARMVGMEEAVYAARGRVTYLAGAAQLDILTDTTERSPTFMIPPFRMEGDTHSPVSWAFVKQPLLPTTEAWETMLARVPRGLDWTAETYAEMNAPDALRLRPPCLKAETLRGFYVGHELDPSRTAAVDSALILILVKADNALADKLVEAYRIHVPAWRRHAVWVIGDDVPDPGVPFLQLSIPVPASPLGLWRRLAVKLAMNVVSTATMGRLGRLYGNGMVWVSPTNKKLIDRGTRLVARHTGMDYAAACHALFAAMEEVSAMQAAGQEAPAPVALAIETCSR